MRPERWFTLSAMIVALLPALVHAEETQLANVSAPTAAPATSGAYRMSDAELDAIVAGKVTIVETGFNTWLVNPGHASVGIVHRDGSFTCINLCGVPPPPPPPGGGGGGN